ncbi:MAG TPA: flagellar export protein FliJ [Solirubrobacteraceae bacterium]|nr:flagellar export protein FliJ [Solirubrobacteraceae bacterium]
MTGLSFRFRLERVRALHERKEELAKQELARALSRRSDSELQLRTVDEHIEQTHAEHRSALADSVTVSAADLLALQAFLERVQIERGASARELERHEAEVAERDAQLDRAAQERKALERLKDRHREEHDREVKRSESSTLDEIALDQFRRSAA